MSCESPPKATTVPLPKHLPKELSIFLDKRKGLCGAGLDGALERLGMAERASVQTTPQTITSVTYLIVPDEGSISGVISTPFSTTLEISNTASDIAVDIQTDASARWRPVKIKRKRRQKMSWGSAPSFSLANLGRYCGPESTCQRFVSGQQLQCLPSTKPEADRARIGLRLLSILGQEAVRVEFRGIGICPRIIEHKPTTSSDR
jgi:hypothetical protein